MNLTKALTDLLSTPGPHLIAIDGPAGSGKSTLAKELYLFFATLHDVNLLGLDDIYDGWENALGEKLASDLGAIARAHVLGECITVNIYDWAQSCFGEKREMNPKEILIIEGVGSAQKVMREHNAITIWMDIDPLLGMQRVLNRDGHHIAEEMKAWQELERQHFALSGARDSADFIITTA